MAASPSSLVSLYRLALRAAAKSVPAHRTWMLHYVRDKFRGGNSPLSPEQRFREGQDELRRFVETLHKTGRLEQPLLPEGPPALNTSASAVCSSSTVEDVCSLPAHASSWSVDEVQRWLRRENLAEEPLASVRARGCAWQRKLRQRLQGVESERLLCCDASTRSFQEEVFRLPYHSKALTIRSRASPKATCPSRRLLHIRSTARCCSSWMSATSRESSASQAGCSASVSLPTFACWPELTALIDPVGSKRSHAVAF